MHCDIRQRTPPTPSSELKRLDHLPLFSANNARKRAEQDAILLANRIRLLRAEEDKAKKKIRETEGKTKEIIEQRRRGDDKRLAREAEEARKEAIDHEMRFKTAGLREEQQRKIQMAQREILDQKVNASSKLKQEREQHTQQIHLEQEEAAAEAAVRALRVRRDLQASERRRARSEGAKLELGKANFQEKLLREEEAARASQLQIARMEKEEQDLIQRLQRSQERHRVAFAQLEDALASNSNASASSSRCPSSMDQIAVQDLPQASAPSSGSRMALAASSSSTECRPMASRPPRPRATPTPPPNAVSGYVATVGKTRPTSASRVPSVPRVLPPVASKPRGSKPAALRDNSETSICSTASGGAGQESGHSTPTSAAPAITYTTVDGLQLEIPPEEEIDLDKLLSGH